MEIRITVKIGKTGLQWTTLPTLICLMFLTLNACESRNTLFLPLTDIESDYLFVVTSNSSSSEFTVVNETARARSDNTQPLFKFNAEDAANVMVIGIDRSTIEERFPGFDPSLIEKMRLIQKDKEPQALQEDIFAELAELVRIQRFDETSSSFEDISNEIFSRLEQQFAISIPFDADRCRNETNERLSYLHPSTQGNECNLPSYIYVQAIDQTRFVASSQKRMHLYDLSAPRKCSDFVARTSSISLSFSDSKSIVAGTQSLPDFQEPNYLVAATTEIFASEQDRFQVIPSAFLLELARITPGGFTLDGTEHYIDVEDINAAITEQCPRSRSPGTPRLIEMTIDNTNRVSLALSTGTIVYLDYGAPKIKYAVICDFSQYALDWLLEVSHINSRPTGTNNYFIGTDNKEGFAYSLTIPSTGADSTQYYVRPTQEVEIRASYYDEFVSPPRFIAVGEGQFSTQAAIQDRALILEQDLQTEELVPLPSYFSNRVENCMVDGHFTEILKIEGNENAHFLLPKCNTVVRMRRQDRCSMLLQLPDFEGTFTTDGPRLRDLALINDQLIAVGDEGLVTTMSLKDIDRP